MQARIRPSGDRPAPATDPYLSGFEPEALEDLARRLCAVRPGGLAAERLMERAAYLRASRAAAADGDGTRSALLFS